MMSLPETDSDFTPLLRDPFARRLSYLRLSVTDLCNFKCVYCLPNGYQGKKKRDELSLSEIQTAVQAFVQSGVRKIRLTGGEPTLRPDIADIIALCKTPEVQSVALTTNAHLLQQKFPLLRAAGLDRLNISIDSFDEETFFQITGKRGSHAIVKAIDEILASGFAAVKINTLLLRQNAETAFADALAYVKDHAVTLRFIELMQTQDNLALFEGQHLAAQNLEARLPEKGWVRMARADTAGPAREYRHADYAGAIGFIAPYSKDFCTSCNRLRLTAQGKMHLCLFDSIAYDLRPWLSTGDVTGLKAHLRTLIEDKPEHHFLAERKVGLIRDLSMIGG